jgi:hypothetical protein
MFRKLSFLEAHELMVICEQAVEAMRPILGDMLYLVHDAVNFYSQTEDNWGCDEDADYAAILALALTKAGYNMLKDEYDVTCQLMTGPSKDA